MKIPRTPPDWFEIFQQSSPEQQMEIVRYRESETTYHHWDKLRHLTPPEGLSSEQWWAATKFRRVSSKHPIPLEDSSNHPFWFCTPLWLQEKLHQIDKQATGFISTSNPQGLNNPEEQKRYLMRSLIEEAITSSQLEGAVTTRVVAREMIRTNRKPVDSSEKMILNNYHAMERIQELKESPLSRELLLELHAILTKDTLEKSDQVGRFRQNEEKAEVVDLENQVLHTGISTEEIERSIAAMCDFANQESPEGEFIHPIIRAILLHFWLAWAHPFCDGNGRTARALFYWSVIRSDYWLLQYTSISEIIRKARIQYGTAFLYTETDDNDVTYFIHYHLKVILRALQAFHQHLQKSQQRIHSVEEILQHQADLNYRQLALLSYALRHQEARFTFESHANSHRVSVPTARTDLNELVKLGLLEKRRITRQFFYYPVSGLEDKIRQLSKGSS